MSDNSTVPLRRSMRNKNKLDSNNVEEKKKPSSRPRNSGTVLNSTNELQGTDHKNKLDSDNFEEKKKPSSRPRNSGTILNSTNELQGADNKNKLDSDNVDDNKKPASRPRNSGTILNSTKELQGTDNKNKLDSDNVDEKKKPSSARTCTSLSKFATEPKDKLEVMLDPGVGQRKLQKGLMKGLDTIPLDVLANCLGRNLLLSFDKKCVLFFLRDEVKDPHNINSLRVEGFKFQYTIYCHKNDNNDDNDDNYEISIMAETLTDASDMIFHVMRMAAELAAKQNTTVRLRAHVPKGQDPPSISCVLTDDQQEKIAQDAVTSSIIGFQGFNFTNQAVADGQRVFQLYDSDGTPVRPDDQTVVKPLASATTTTNSSSNGQFSFLPDEPNMPPTTTTATKNDVAEHKSFGVGKRQRKNDPGQEPCDDEQQKPAAIKKARSSTPPAVVATSGPVDSAPRASANNNNQVMEVHSASTAPLLKKASNGTTFTPSSVTAPEAEAPVCGGGSVQAAATLKSVPAPPAPSYGTSSSTARSNDFTFAPLSSNCNFYQGSNDDTAGPSTAPLFETSPTVAAPVSHGNVYQTAATEPFATSSNGGFLSGKATAPSNGTTIAPLSETAPVVASSTSGGSFVQAAAPVPTIDSKTGFTFGSGGGSGAPSRVAPASGMDQSTTGTKTEDLNRRLFSCTPEPPVFSTTPAPTSAQGTIASDAKQSAEASGTWSTKIPPHSNTRAPGSVATSETSASKLPPRAPGVLSNNRHPSSSAPKSDISTGKFPSVLPTTSASAAKPPLAPTSARPSAAKSDASTGEKKPPPPRFRIETHSSNRQCSLPPSDTDASDHGSDSESNGSHGGIKYKKPLSPQEYDELTNEARQSKSRSEPSPSKRSAGPSPSKRSAGPSPSKRSAGPSPSKRVLGRGFGIDPNAPGLLSRPTSNKRPCYAFYVSNPLGENLYVNQVAMQALEKDTGFFTSWKQYNCNAKAMKAIKKCLLVDDFTNAKILQGNQKFFIQKLFPAMKNLYVEQQMKAWLGILPEENLNTKTTEYWDDPDFQKAVEEQLPQYAVDLVAEDLFKKREKKEFTTKLGTILLLHPKETLQKRFNDVFGDKQPEGAEHPWDLLKEKMSEEDLVLAIGKALTSLEATYVASKLLSGCKTPIEDAENKMSELLRTKYSHYDGCGDFHDAVKREVVRLNVVSGGNHAEYLVYQFEKQCGKQDTTAADSNSNSSDSTMTQVIQTMEKKDALHYQERESSAVRQQEERGQLVATAERDRQADRQAHEKKDALHYQERESIGVRQQEERGQFVETTAQDRLAERDALRKLLGDDRNEREAAKQLESKEREAAKQLESKEREATNQLHAETVRTIIATLTPGGRHLTQQTIPITGAQGVVPTLGWTTQAPPPADYASSQTAGQVLHQQDPPSSQGLGLHPHLHQQMSYVLQHPPTMSGQGIALAGAPPAADYASSQTAGQVLYQYPPGPGVVYAVGPNQQMPYYSQQPPVPTTSLSTQATPPDNAASAQQQGPPVGGFYFPGPPAHDATSQMAGSQVHQPAYHHQQQQQPVAPAQATAQGVQQQQQQNDDVDMAE